MMRFWRAFEPPPTPSRFSRSTIRLSKKRLLDGRSQVLDSTIDWSTNREAYRSCVVGRGSVAPTTGPTTEPLSSDLDSHHRSTRQMRRNGTKLIPMWKYSYRSKLKVMR